jgi:hypothetical protein
VEVKAAPKKKAAKAEKPADEATDEAAAEPEA